MINDILSTKDLKALRLEDTGHKIGEYKVYTSHSTRWVLQEFWEYGTYYKPIVIYDKDNSKIRMYFTK